MEIKQVSTTEIIPYEKNAKMHPAEQVEWIANSYKNGVRKVYEIQKRQNFIKKYGFFIV